MEEVSISIATKKCELKVDPLCGLFESEVDPQSIWIKTEFKLTPFYGGRCQEKLEWNLLFCFYKGLAWFPDALHWMATEWLALLFGRFAAHFKKCFSWHKNWFCVWLNSVETPVPCMMCPLWLLGRVTNLWAAGQKYCWENWEIQSGSFAWQSDEYTNTKRWDEQTCSLWLSDLD